MKRKILTFLLAIPVLIVAGSWTGIGATHMAALKNAASVTWLGDIAALLSSVLNLTSRITEESGFLVMGACFISLAWALHRKSTRNRGL